MNDSEILAFCSQFTMGSIQRQKQTLQSINHVVQNNVQGDIIEIGVWKGGMIMIMLLKLMQLGITDRKVHLYDTFTGMTEPSVEDVCRLGQASNLGDLVKCECAFDNVYANVLSTGYPIDNITFHKGDIRLIDPNIDVPSKIAVLRLDNDWFELYKFELPVFEPNVQINGIITIDDYGYWNGCKKAIDAYLELLDYNVCITQIDDCGIYWYKLANSFCSLLMHTL